MNKSMLVLLTMSALLSASGCKQKPAESSMPAAPMSDAAPAAVPQEPAAAVATTPPADDAGAMAMPDATPQTNTERNMGAVKK